MEEIIDLLIDEAMTVNEVAQNFDISRTTVSKHIKIRHECGLVIIHQKERRRFCSTDPRKLRDVAEWAAEYQKLSSQKLDTLEAALDEEE